MNLTDLQNKIEESYPRPIRLEKTKRKRKESLQEFLILFFTEWNQEKNTVYVDNGELQTDICRRRSLGDIFMICKYYYQDLKLQDLLYELYVALPKHFHKGFRTSYCHTINKRVWYYEENAENGTYDKIKHDEYGNPYSYYLAFFVDDLPEDEEEEEMCGNCEEYLEDCKCEHDYYDDDNLCGDPDCEVCYA